MVHKKLFDAEYNSLTASPPAGTDSVTPVYIALYIRKFIDLVSKVDCSFALVG